jgi:ArsR family transcriptional regulator
MARRRILEADRHGWVDVALLLRTVAHPVRLRILDKLAHGACCVKDLNELMPVSQPVLSQHMAALRRMELVSNYARGALRCYYLTQPELVTRLLALVKEAPAPRTRAREDVFAEVDGRV